MSSGSVIRERGEEVLSGGRGDATASGISSARLGLWIFLGTVTMLFAAFTSALLVRRSAADWSPIAPPPVLYLNTAILLASSLILEMGRRREPVVVHRTLSWTFLLGILFLGGQMVAWSKLAGQGVYLPTSPHSAFFYILTGLHGLHLLAGLAVLIAMTLRVRRVAAADELPRRLSEQVGLAAVFWHFLDGLWIYLVLVLFWIS